MLIFPCIAMMRDPNLCPRTEKVLLNISGCKEQNNSVRKKRIFFLLSKTAASWWKDWLSPVFNSEVLMQSTPQLDDDSPNQQRQTCIHPSSLLIKVHQRETVCSLPSYPHILESQGFLVRETHTLQYPINHCELKSKLHNEYTEKKSISWAQ